MWFASHLKISRLSSPAAGVYGSLWSPDHQRLSSLFILISVIFFKATEGIRFQARLAQLQYIVPYRDLKGSGIRLAYAIINVVFKHEDLFLYIFIIMQKKYFNLSTVFL